MLPYNDLAAVREAFAAHGDQIAAVITEAAAGNMGVVPPGVGTASASTPFLAEHLRTRTARCSSRRGDDRLPGQPRPASAASTASTPDLMTFGKVIGGGFPAAAFGGRAE